MSVETPVNYRQTGVALMVLALAAMATKSQAAKIQYYYNLADDLFEGYKKDVPPVEDDSTTVYITFHLYSIVDMNEQDQTMKTNGMLEIWWVDYNLSWDESDYSNISSVMFPQSSVWLPDIVVGNSVTSQTQLGYSELQVSIFSEGWVMWLPREVFETSCDFDVTYYPFDTQVCSIDFTSASSSGNQLPIEVNKTVAVDTLRFSEDAIWELVGTSVDDNQTTDWRAQLSFILQLKRRPASYVLSIIAPVVLLAMTSSLVFALPAKSGEKMSLSITLLLAFAVYLTLVSNDMPKTSVNMSVLKVYVIQLMALTTMSVILSVLLIKLHHRPSPLGTKATKVIVLLRKVMCMSADQRLCKVAKAKPSSQNGRRPYIVNEHNAIAIAPCDNSHDNDCRSPSASSTERSLEVEVSPVSGQVASETISMFLFYIFFLYSIVLTIVYIIILVTGGARQKETTRLTQCCDTDRTSM